MRNTITLSNNLSDSKVFKKISCVSPLIRTKRLFRLVITNPIKIRPSPTLVDFGLLGQLKQLCLGFLNVTKVLQKVGDGSIIQGCRLSLPPQCLVIFKVHLFNKQQPNVLRVELANLCASHYPL